MLLVEFASQGVRGFAASVQQRLAAGYNVLVSEAAPLGSAVTAVLFPGEAGVVNADVAVPGKVFVTLVGNDGLQYRLERELGVAWQLFRLSADAGVELLTEDTNDIAQFLKGTCSLPSPELFRLMAVTSRPELPSQRATSSIDDVAALRTRAQLLRDELKLTRDYELAADELFSLQAQVREHEVTLGGGAEQEVLLSELRDKLRRYDDVPDLTPAVLQRAQRAEELAFKHELAHSEIVAELKRLDAQLVQFAVPALVRNQLFLGGVAGGLLPLALASVVGEPRLVALDVVGFGVAAAAAWRWIDQRQKLSMVQRKRHAVAERETRLQATREAELRPLEAALKAFKVETTDALVAILEERATLLARRAELEGELAERRKSPEYLAAATEREALLVRVKELEAQAQKTGFVRATVEIERELHDAETSLAGRSRAGGAATTEAFTALAKIVASATGAAPAAATADLQPRIAAYLQALSERRLGGARYDAAQGWLVATAQGARQAVALPPAEQDVVYLAVKLAALERIAPRKVPLVFDDPFGLLTPPLRVLAMRMLKGLSAQTQVLHRCQESPPAGVADAGGQL